MQWLELKIPPIIQILFTACLMYLADMYFLVAFMYLTDVSIFSFEFAISLRMEVVGILVVFGATVALAGVINFRIHHTTMDPRFPDQTSNLVTGGVYRFTRNPMYFGFLFILLGWSVWLSNYIAVIMVVPYVFYITRFQIIPEERFIEEQFGDEYQEYKSRVRRWI